MLLLRGKRCGREVKGPAAIFQSIYNSTLEALQKKIFIITRLILLPSRIGQRHEVPTVPIYMI